MKKRNYFCFILCILICLSSVSYANEPDILKETSVDNSENNIAILSSTDSDSITNGIKNFQNYINENLPISYLGTTLTVDGVCTDATKTAAIKFVQYTLNQSNAGLAVDGGFGSLSQTAFSNYVGTIEKGETGVWVYILQGLLYCHGYDPNGFDGSYGAAGGTGCLNAVNNFKRDNAITEGSEDMGTVGITTMKCLLWCTDSRIIEDGMFYIKNSYTGKYLNVQSDAPATGDYLTQASKLTGSTNLRQLWKITYVGDGYYSLRPLNSISLALTNYSSGNAGLFDITLEDNLTTVVNGSRWKLVETSSGEYNILWYGKSDKSVAIKNDSTAENASVIITDSQQSSSSGWVLEKKDYTTVKGCIFVDDSFIEYFGTNSMQEARKFVSYATIPFKEFMNYSITRTTSVFSEDLPSDLCEHGYYNETTTGSCCSITSCSHNVNTDAQCKCTYRIYGITDTKEVTQQLKIALFTFDTCYGGLGGVGGDTSVVLISRNNDPTTTAYMNSVRRIQHELTHNFGGTHQSETDPCSGRCINNGGYDNVYDYELSCIWCNRCLTYMNVNKF